MKIKGKDIVTLDVNNKIRLPNEIVDMFDTEYFEVKIAKVSNKPVIVLVPVKIKVEGELGDIIELSVE